MPYTPINADVYVAAYTGAIGGMTVGGGWLNNPTNFVPSSYNNLCIIAGAYAQEVDIVWNSATLLTSLEFEKIQCISEQLFIQRGAQPAANPQFQSPLNWQTVAFGLVAAVQQADAFLTSQGITPTPPGGGGTQRARGVVTVPIDPNAFLLAGPGNDGITYVLGDTLIAIGEGSTPPALRENIVGAPPPEEALSGPWIVSAVAGPTGTLVRPPWWASGAVLQTSGIPIEVGSEGTVYCNTRFRAMGPQVNGVVNAISRANTFIVDTDDPGMYPEVMTVQAALQGGTTDIIIPVYSASSAVSVIDLTNRPSTTAYYIAQLFAGSLGSGSQVTITAYTTGGIPDEANNNTVNVGIINQVVNFRA